MSRTIHRADIPGFNNYYVTPSGRVFRNDGREKKPSINKKGYLVVSLRSEGRQYLRRVHRLVAEAFIPNPENKPQVNHKNGDKHDNRVGNLEWATPHENIQHSYDTALRGTSAVDMLGLDGRYIRTFPSLKAAETFLGATRPNGAGICNCLRGDGKTAYGHKWRRHEEGGPP